MGRKESNQTNKELRLTTHKRLLCTILLRKPFNLYIICNKLTLKQLDEAINGSLHFQVDSLLIAIKLKIKISICKNAL